MSEPTEEEIHAARSVLARRATVARTEARRANLAKARAARPATECNCDRPDGRHRVRCPVYRREAIRKWRENKSKQVDG